VTPRILIHAAAAATVMIAVSAAQMSAFGSLVGTSGGPAQAMPGDVVATVTAGEDISAHYVLLVDTSGSMAAESVYAQVSPAVSNLVQALPTTDLVSLIAFDVTPRQCGSGVLPAADGPGILACLPTEATGDYTDFGRALDAGISELEATDTAIRSLILISDGTQDPAPGSPYPSEGVADNPAWQDLAARATALGDVEAYALPISGNATGAEILGYVFATPEVLQVATAGDLGSALAQSGVKIRSREATLILAEDTTRGLDVDAAPLPTLDQAGAGWRIDVTSTSTFIPYTLTDLALTLSDGNIEVTGLPRSIRLEPGQSVTLRPQVRLATTGSGVRPATAGGGSGPASSPATTGATATSENPSTRAQLSATVQTEWEDALIALGLSNDQSLVEDVGAVKVDPPDAPATVTGEVVERSASGSAAAPDSGLQPLATAPTASAVSGPLRWILVGGVVMLIAAGLVSAAVLLRSRPRGDPASQ